MRYSLNKGDTLYCKKDFYFISDLLYKAGKLYTIHNVFEGSYSFNEGSTTFVDVIYMDYGTRTRNPDGTDHYRFPISELYDTFYTLKESRKLKLKKLLC